MFFKRKWISIGIIFAAILLLAIPVIAVNRAYPRAEQVEISVGESFDWKGISVRVNGMRTGTDTDRGTLSEEEQEQLRGIGLPAEGWYYAVVDLTFANETEESKSGLWWSVHLQSEVFSNGCMGFLGEGLPEEMEAGDVLARTALFLMRESAAGDTRWKLILEQYPQFRYVFLEKQERG